VSMKTIETVAVSRDGFVAVPILCILRYDLALSLPGLYTCTRPNSKLGTRKQESVGRVCRLMCVTSILIGCVRHPLEHGSHFQQIMNPPSLLGWSNIDRDGCN